MEKGDYEEVCSLLENVNNKKNENLAIQAEKKILVNAKKGSLVLFGKFEQDGKDDSMENIEWIVLQRNDDRVLVISRYALIYDSYCESIGDEANWKDSKIRLVLNSDFLNTSFRKDENKLIPTVNTKYEKYEYGELQESYTNDKVFILSAEEVKKYFSSDKERQAEYTPAVDGYEERTDHLAEWYLRSIVINGPYGSPTYVDAKGAYSKNNTRREDKCEGIRPALWIDVQN